jgi:hypothetical protein
LSVDEALDADAFHLENNKGQRQPLYMKVEGQIWSAWSIDITGGRSIIGYSAEGEATVVLTREEKEIYRAQVTLQAGGLHELLL